MHLLFTSFLQLKAHALRTSRALLVYLLELLHEARCLEQGWTIIHCEQGQRIAPGMRLRDESASNCRDTVRDENDEEADSSRL